MSKEFITIGTTEWVEQSLGCPVQKPLGFYSVVSKA